MCYTVAINKRKAELERRFDVAVDELEYDPQFAVSGFLHPKLPVITSDQPGKMGLAQWGLIPRWVKSREQAAELHNQTLNAKGETLLQKPSFRESALTKKCIIPVNGFFEWQTRGKIKQPYFIYMPEQALFGLGGLWEDWVDTMTGEVIRTFTIVTTPANQLMEEIHNEKKRMPLIIPEGQESAWLSSTDEHTTSTWIHPFADTVLQAHPVSKLVNGRNGNPNVPEVQNRVNDTPIQGTLF
jgi:putative SOS response-associated peptidase YedK